MLQDFIALHLDNCYVCSKTSCDNETRQKSNFVVRHYEIPKERMIFVETTDEKLEAMGKIYQMHSDVNPKHVVIIEDTVKTLDYIFERSQFSTVHVSSFFE